MNIEKLSLEDLVKMRTKDFENMSQKEFFSIVDRAKTLYADKFHQKKEFLQSDFNELERYFKSQDCVFCQLFFFYNMSEIIDLIEQVLLWQSEKHQNEHH